MIVIFVYLFLVVRLILNCVDLHALFFLLLLYVYLIECVYFSRSVFEFVFFIYFFKFYSFNYGIYVSQRLGIHQVFFFFDIL